MFCTNLSVRFSVSVKIQHTDTVLTAHSMLSSYTHFADTTDTATYWYKNIRPDAANYGTTSEEI